MHPAFPVREGLDDEFVIVVRREVRAVVLQPVYNKFAFFVREESGRGGVLSTVKEQNAGTDGEEGGEIRRAW